MNSLIETEFPLSECQNLRYDLMNVLTDSDLAYKLPGDNPTLGELCREIGEHEHVQFQIYREALLVFFAKASVYLKALQKPMNDQWQAGIG